MYLVAGIICLNEEELIRYSIGSIYSHVDQIIFVDGFSSDKTIEYIKELDVDNKIKIIQSKFRNDYSAQRNIYIDYIKKNVYPAHKRDLWYLRIDSDEIYVDGWLDDAKKMIEENPDAEGIRSNFFSFTADYNSLDTSHPTESRVSLFKFAPDLTYTKPLHEWPIHRNTGIPLYGSPQEDKKLGIYYATGYSYLHMAWCSPTRCFQKAKNYTEHYVKDGTETLEHLQNMTPTKDSFWWNKKSDIRYKGKLPSIFKKYGLLPGQENPEQEQNDKPKISVYTFIKNAISQDYPIIEAIRSVLPIADEVIVNLGDSTDGTTGMMKKAFAGISKVKMFESIWEGREQGTAFLRNQSNKAKDKCFNQVCLYLQSDECYSEKDYDKILFAAKTLYEREDLVGAITQFCHFDGDFGTVNPNSYPQEVRMIKKDKLESIGDAQSMGMLVSEKDMAKEGQRKSQLVNVMALKDLLLETRIQTYHVGWAREPKKMLHKLKSFDSFYHDDGWLAKQYENEKEIHKDGNYNYGSRDRHLEWTGTLPYVLYAKAKRYEKLYPENIKYKAKFDV